MRTTPVNQSHGHQGQNRRFVVHLILLMRSQQQKTPSTLNLGYSIFEKRVQTILGKKRKTTSADGISSLQTLSKQSQNEDIPGTAAKKEDQLEVGSNKNIFIPKNAASCDKLGDTISTTDFEVNTDNQHVDSCIVTYKHMDLLTSFLFIVHRNQHFYSY